MTNEVLSNNISLWLKVLLGLFGVSILLCLGVAFNYLETLALWGVVITSILGMILLTNVQNHIHTILVIKLSGERNQQIIAEENEKVEQDKQEIETKLNDKIQSLISTVGQLTPAERPSALLSHLAKELSAVQGAYYKATTLEGKRFLKLSESYAFHLPDSEELMYEFGEGLCGQVAKDGQTIRLKEVPVGYITALSGLGKTTPSHMVITPIKSESGEVKAVLEIAAFSPFSEADERLIVSTAQQLI